MIAGVIRIAAPLAAMLCMAATAFAQPGPREQLCAQNEAQFPALIGRDPQFVEAALRAMPGITTVRVGGPNTPMTRDYRPDRATVLVVDGVVRSITCG